MTPWSGVVDRRRAVFAALSVVALGASAGCRRRPVPGPVLAPTVGPLKPLDPAATANLFHPGSRHRLDTGASATAEVVPAGSLQLPTGRLVAIDPSWLSPTPLRAVEAFTVPVPPGTYPLDLALLRWDDDLRVGAARLAVTDRPVTAWEMAVCPGEDPATLEPGHFFGVGVDVATIAVFDAVAVAEMGRLVDADREAFVAWSADRPVHRAEVLPGANAISFTTGWGDGSYPVWIGRSDDGAVACFLFDMLMLADPGRARSGP